jgi:2-polyprenyl-3-methyl-5-hydroxy-6-metoxy-1,4-benzoquinol methylase
MNEIYNADYYGDYAGTDYKDRQIWIPFFKLIAGRVIADFNPKTALDAGCALGYLVESLRKGGVEAFGVDISEYAINLTDNSIKDYCYIGDISRAFPEGLDKKFDVITCIEVLEHLNEKAGKNAIQNICGHTDIVIFSSSPEDFEGDAHDNVQKIEYWAKLFAENGFYKDLNYNVAYISRQAAVFRRLNDDIPTIIYNYEKKLRITNDLLNKLEKRRILKKALRKLSALFRKITKRISKSDKNSHKS